MPKGVYPSPNKFTHTTHVSFQSLFVAMQSSHGAGEVCEFLYLRFIVVPKRSVNGTDWILPDKVWN